MIMKKNSVYTFLKPLLLLVVVFGALFFFSKQTSFESIQDSFSATKINSAIKTLKKEVKSPGALFAKIESSNAFLTNRF